jgi:hypothetical protein
MRASPTYLLLGALVLIVAVQPQAVRAQTVDYCATRTFNGWTIEFTENPSTGMLLGTGDSFNGIGWLVTGARVPLADGESHLVLSLINPNMFDDSGCTDGAGFGDYGSFSGRVTGGEDGVYTYNPRTLNSCNHVSQWFMTITEGDCPTINTEDEAAVGRGYRVDAAYPNPFAEETLVRLAVHEAQHVRAEVYDALGRRVAVLHDGPIGADVTQTLRLDGRGLAPGPYVVRFTGEAFTASRKVLLVK